MESEIEEIFNYCVQIRNSILKVQNETSIFQNFPFGCCRDSSLLIGYFLTEIRIENISYCRGVFNNDTNSHAWLEYKNYIIDITANQFGNLYRDVIVMPDKIRFKIHKKSHSEAYSLGIAGMDAIRILNDYELIKKNL